MTLGKVPLRGLLIYVKNNAFDYDFRKSPLRGLLMYDFRKSPLKGLLMYMKNNASG